MEEENLSPEKWKKINIDEFKKSIEEFKGYNVMIEVKSFIRTAITIEKCQFIINKLNFIISDENDLQLEVDIDPSPELYTRGKYYFKLCFSEFDGEILLDFFK